MYTPYFECSGKGGWLGYLRLGLLGFRGVREPCEEYAAVFCYILNAATRNSLARVIKAGLCVYAVLGNRVRCRLHKNRCNGVYYESNGQEMWEKYLNEFAGFVVLESQARFKLAVF